MLAFISFVGGSLTTMISLSYIVVSMGVSNETIS